MRFSIRESDAAFLREGQRYKISCHNKGAAESAATGTLLGKAQDVETPENGGVNAVPLMVGKLLETTIGHLVHKTAVPQRSSERPASPECSRSPERQPHHRDRKSTGSRRNSCHSTCGSMSPTRTNSYSRRRSPNRRHQVKQEQLHEATVETRRRRDRKQEPTHQAADDNRRQHVRSRPPKRGRSRAPWADIRGPTPNPSRDHRESPMPPPRPPQDCGY